MTDITAERLHMEVEREDYWEPNWTKPLVMFTKWHAEGSRDFGRTECRTTLPEAYQLTTEQPPDVLPQLPTELAA
jgi:hypothetical protein